MALLQNIEKNCPQCIQDCLRPILLFFYKHAHKKEKRESNGIQHLEEEEFQFSAKYINQEQNQTNIHQVYSRSQKQHFQSQQEMDVKIGLNNQSQSNSLMAEPVDTPSISSYNFKLNLQPLDQYYQLIEGKTRNLENYFQQQTEAILTRRVKSMITIKNIQTLSGFKFIISYQLPCSYYYYGQLVTNQNVNSGLCSTIADNKIIEVVHPNLAIQQLKFKKFMLLEPRYFNYIKYHNSSGHSHWEVCISTKGRPSADMPQKECELFSISCFEESREHLNVNTYLQVDVKSNIRAKKVVHRVCEEMANYIDKLWEHIKENYQDVEA